MDVVALLKEEDCKDAYRSTLSEKHVGCLYVPALGSQRHNASELRDLLRRPATFEGGIILTSQRASTALVDELSSATSDDAVSEDLSRVKNIPVYVVGQRTRSALRDVFKTTRGDEAGNAEALAETIIRDVQLGNRGGSSSVPKGMLFLCGDKRLDVLPSKLTAAGIPLIELAVYRTIPLPGEMIWGAILDHLRQRAMVTTGRAEVDEQPSSIRNREVPLSSRSNGDLREQHLFIVLFSPSGLQALLGHPPAAAALAAGSVEVPAAHEGRGESPVGDDAGSGPLTATSARGAARFRTHLVALGATTAAAIRAAGLPFEPGAVCDTPDASGVAAAVGRMLEAHAEAAHVTLPCANDPVSWR